MKGSTKNMKQVVDEIIKAKQALKDFYNLKTPAPIPNLPAPSEEIDALETHLRSRQLPLPPSYRAFLVAQNGIKGFDANLDLLSAQEVRNPADEELEEDFPTLSKFVIASGNTPAFISFDPETADEDGEMEVVWVMGDGGEFRYPNFDAFLREFGDELQKTLALEREDRQYLGD